MMRGALLLAAQMFFCLLLPVVSLAQTRVLRTRDAGFATVKYDNGLTLGALTLYEGLEARRKNSSSVLNGVLSLFHDGRWSVQGYFLGSAVSDPIPLTGRAAAMFGAMRGETSLGVASSAQSGFMPTLQLTGRSRLLFDTDSHGIGLGAAVARSFEGRRWLTTVMGDASGWIRRGSSVFTVRSQPMQLASGDVIEDTEGALEFAAGSATIGTSLGVRTGEVERGSTAWGAVSVTVPLRDDLWAALSVGSYPQDLLQSLPGGRYASITFRLPNGKLPPLRRRPPPPPPAPRPPELLTTVPLAIAFGFALDSTSIREVRVWAPGVTKVELMADFVDWIPVPLLKQPNGEWRGYYRASPGLHRVQLMLDDTELAVPAGGTRSRDDMLGDVALIIIR